MKTNYKYRLLNDAIEAANTPGVTLMSFLKSLTIVDAIYMIVEAWNNVSQTALKGKEYTL